MWKSVSCAVQGIGHKKHNVPCQDKTFELTLNDVHVVALADGAGSARLSHYGAERVVREASAHVAKHFYEFLDYDDGRDVKRDILNMLRDSLAQEAQLHDCSVQDLASTLLLAAVDRNNFILVHIGDGVIGYLDGCRLKVASFPDNGEHSNETIFVTSNDAIASMRLFKGELGDKDGFVLISDGTEQSLFNKRDKSMAHVVVKLMHSTCLIDANVLKVKLEHALASVISKKTQDDCSIAILSRPSNLLCPIAMLDYKKRLDLYEIAAPTCRAHKRVHRYDSILALTETQCSLECIAREIHLKPKYAKKHVIRLMSLGLLLRNGLFYQKVQ